MNETEPDAPRDPGMPADDEERPARPMMLLLVLFPFVLALAVFLILRWVAR